MRPPYVDTHAVEVAAPREEAWGALQRFVERSLRSGGGLLHTVLGTDPPAGFEIAATTPNERLELSGRHRFSRYVLAFQLSDGPPGRTRVAAETYAEFPGIHGRAYRALVIGSRLHVVATRRMLHAIRRRAEG
jgi:hypothetical protein